MAHRRKLSPFSLAFLDVMFCGFGAVVLLVLLVNAQTLRSRDRQHEDLRAEVDRLAQEVRAGELYFKQLQAGIQKEEDALASLRVQAQQEQRTGIHLQEQFEHNEEQLKARRQQVAVLSSELKKIEEENRSREATAPRVQGNKVRRYEGDGHRQYLTGLKLGGQRVLILVDGSASMLDTSVVGVIRKRNMAKAAQWASAKWQQVQKTVLWLVANLPASSKVRLMVFNTTVQEGKDGPWLPVTDAAAIGNMLNRFQKILPAGGTSLENAFTAAAALQPRPDNIVLLTDGLPTLGRGKARKGLVSGVQRARYFEQAVKKVPKTIPVNTILFPMEGDPQAAVLYWQLAIQTKGSFLTPTADWP